MAKRTVYMIDGKEVSKAAWMGRTPGQKARIVITDGTNTRNNSGWPWVTTFAGTTRSGAPGLRKFLAERKCDARVRDDGSVECDSKAIRNHYLGCRNLFDMNAGYGDRTPKNF